MRTNYCWVTTPNGECKYFSESDLKRANEFAQAQADATGKTVIRYDIDGGQSWFYASAINTDGYKVYAGCE